MESSVHGSLYNHRQDLYTSITSQFTFPNRLPSSPLSATSTLNRRKSYPLDPSPISVVDNDATASGGSSVGKVNPLTEEARNEDHFVTKMQSSLLDSTLATDAITSGSSSHTRKDTDPLTSTPMTDVTDPHSALENARSTERWSSMSLAGSAGNRMTRFKASIRRRWESTQGWIVDKRRDINHRFLQFHHGKPRRVQNGLADGARPVDGSGDTPKPTAERETPFPTGFGAAKDEQIHRPATAPELMMKSKPLLSLPTPSLSLDGLLGVRPESSRDSNPGRLQMLESERDCKEPKRTASAPIPRLLAFPGASNDALQKIGPTACHASDTTPAIPRGISPSSTASIASFAAHREEDIMAYARRMEIDKVKINASLVSIRARSRLHHDRVSNTTLIHPARLPASSADKSIAILTSQTSTSPPHDHEDKGEDENEVEGGQRGRTWRREHRKSRIYLRGFDSKGRMIVTQEAPHAPQRHHLTGSGKRRSWRVPPLGIVTVAEEEGEEDAGSLSPAETQVQASAQDLCLSESTQSAASRPFVRRSSNVYNITSHKSSPVLCSVRQ